MKLFNNPTKAVIAILLVLGLFLAYKAKATEVEFGATYTSKFNGGVGLIVSERFGDKFDLSLGLIGEQSWENVQVDNNGVVWGSFVAARPDSWSAILPAEVHLGVGSWFKTQAPINGGYATFHLALKWHFGEHASIAIRHWSNAGTTPPNRGQDLLTFGWRF